jgi:hypothetical protein
MDSKSDRTVNGIPQWACPWAAGWTGMHNRVHTLPKNSLRRIKRVGVAATSFAATLWLLALVWIWQIA